MANRTIIVGLAILYLIVGWADAAFAQNAAPAPGLPMSSGNSVPLRPVPWEHSQQPHYYSVPVVPYTIQSESRATRFEVRTEFGQPLVRCAGSCRLALPLGRYRLALFDEQGREERGTRFDVKGSARLKFERANTELATLGAIIGVTGAALIIGGDVVVMQNACIISDCEQDKPKMARLGLGAMLLGAVLTPLGWAMFCHNLTPTIHEYPLVSPHFTTAGTIDGASFGFTGAF
jgi:hypothetical protein